MFNNCIRRIFFVIFCFAIFIFSSEKVFATNLLINSGFEDGISSWSKYGGSLDFVSDYVHSGTEAAQLTSTTVSTKWIYQVASVVGGTAYVFSGYLIKNSPNISSVLLRIAWYSSLDGSSSELSHADSPDQLIDNNAEYRLLSTGAVVVPDDAHSARVKAVVAFNSTSQTSAYFDDFIFEETALPTPTSDPTSTPTLSLTPSPLAPSLALRASPTPSKPPTTPTLKPTPSPAVALAKEGSPTIEEVFVLAAATTLSPTASPAVVQENKSSNNILPIILVGVGLLFLTVSGFLLLKNKNEGYN